MKLGKKGSLLIAAYAILLFLLGLGGVFFARSIADRKLLNTQKDDLQAVYLAESGIDQALFDLRQNRDLADTDPDPNNVASYSFSYDNNRSYKYTFSTSSGNKVIIGYGYVLRPDGRVVEGRVEAIARFPNFYGNALYSAGDIEIKGTSYSVDGQAVYADTIIGVTTNITGGATQDESISPLAEFNYSDLRAIAESQTNPSTIAGNNVYTAQDLQDKNAFPQFFYNQYNQPGVPNVVYVEGALSISGNVNLGGFYVVVGNILDDPNAVVDVATGGTLNIDGCIYTRGELTIKGDVSVAGGVWAGEKITLDGGIAVTYNAANMDAVKVVAGDPTANQPLQFKSWKRLKTW